MNRRVLRFDGGSRTQLEDQREEAPITPRIVLEELYLLLEDYAPVWYTQTHHDRAVKALLQRDA